MKLYILMLMAVIVLMIVVMRQHRVCHCAVRYNLNRAAVVVELLLCDDVRVVTMYRAIYTDDVLDHAGNRSDIVRYHNYRHSLVKLV